MTYCSQFKFLCISILLLTMTSCSLNNNQHFQQIADTSKAEYKIWHHSQTEASQVNKITDLVAIPQLTELIDQAMKQNPGLQQTAIALQIAYEQRGVTTSDRIPQLSAGFSANDKKESEATYNANLTVSWELDLWQKISDNVAAAEMDIASSEATYQSARDALAANMMRSWLQVNYQQQLIAIEVQRLKVLESNEITIRERYRSGLGTLDALEIARSNSASTHATLTNYQEQLAKNKRKLWQLAGLSKANEKIDINDLFPDVLQPLAGLPEQDLGRRPDLQNAYYKIIAQQYRTDVAYKALLPSINISAALTDIASSPSNALFTSPAWSLLGQLTAPLFQGGKLRSKIEIAKLTTEKNYWAYQDTLLIAVNEVENYLGQEQSLSQQQQHINNALNSAKINFSNYQIKYRQGVVDILDLLSVQQRTFNLQAQLTQTIYNRLINRIDLGLALGLGVSS